MTVFAVEGAAGCGKTFRLMDALKQKLIDSPLSSGQRVLALTFMHGSRKRLEERLRRIPNLRGCFECITIDSLAWRLCCRWSSLRNKLNLTLPTDRDFNLQCQAAGALLENQDVQNWFKSSFPIVLVDEAQDLTSHRLRMIQGISQVSDLFIAADEFQCLNQDLRPNPLVAWISQVCQPEILTTARRTNVTELLNASTAIRSGQSPATGKNFTIHTTPVVPVASVFLGNAINWHPNNSIAILTPSFQGGFSQQIIQKVIAGFTTKKDQKTYGPYSVRVERSEAEEIDELLNKLGNENNYSLEEILYCLNELPNLLPVRKTKDWAILQHRALGKTNFARSEIEEVLRRQIQLARQYPNSDGNRLLAMTIQQAKNREFDGVVVLWPYQVGGDDEHKRRLLYNAVTRARTWCNIFVQNDRILQSAPFTAAN